jgi:hypothetical protein
MEGGKCLNHYILTIFGLTPKKGNFLIHKELKMALLSRCIYNAALGNIVGHYT